MYDLFCEAVSSRSVSIFDTLPTGLNLVNRPKSLFTDVQIEHPQKLKGTSQMDSDTRLVSYISREVFLPVSSIDYYMCICFRQFPGARSSCHSVIHMTHGKTKNVHQMLQSLIPEHFFNQYQYHLEVVRWIYQNVGVKRTQLAFGEGIRDFSCVVV